jgi:hypothetical protein
MADKKKLTVRVDRRWIEPAKEYARDHNTSLSTLISEYLRRLTRERQDFEDAPILQRLAGILPSDVSMDEHREHLEEKYGR